MSTDAQPSRLRRFFRSWWTRGFLLTLAFCAGSYFYNEWKWERRWQAYVTEAHARGVKVYITEYLPAEPIPDAENFAATPLWKEVFAQDGQGPRAKKLASVKLDSKLKKQPKGSQRPGQTDLAAWRASLAKVSGSAKSSESISDAEAVLKALEFVEPEIAEIRDALLRPKVQFPTKWEDGYSVRLPHYSVVQAVGRILSLTVSVRIAAADTGGALRDFRTLMGLVEKLDREPSLIGALVELSVVELASSSVVDGINSSAWTPAQLQEIEAHFAGLNMIERFTFALNSERASTMTGMEQIMNTVGGDWWLGGLTGPGNWLGSLYVGRRSYFRENQLWLAAAFEEELSMWKPEQERWVHHDRVLSGNAIKASWKKYDLIFATFVWPVYETAHARGIMSHARVRMAGLACALERHRIARGAYPDALDALIPEFLPKLPHDPCDGQPFRYRLNEEGYLLYSIGTDRVDDSGKVNDLADQASGPDWRWWSPAPPQP